MKPGRFWLVLVLVASLPPSVLFVPQLKEHNMCIVAAIGLTNRNEFRNDKKSVKEALASEGVTYYEMSSANTLLDILKTKPSL